MSQQIVLDIHKKMPFGSGLGSSAASAVAGVFAVNTLLGNPLTKKELLHFAVLGEQLADGSYHADNVAPARWRLNPRCDVSRTTCSHNFRR